MHRGKDEETGKSLPYSTSSRKVDTLIFFFLGILIAVAALQSAGQLRLLAKYLDENLGSVY
ncbi:MAG: hypothetical protein R2727_08675 [Bacteroidales bacterium]